MSHTSYTTYPTYKSHTQTLMRKSLFRFLFFAAILFIFYDSPAEAASLYFSPSSGSYAVEKTFSVNVYVSSNDQAINAASGIISFPADKLQVVSLSKSGSIFNLWVQEPSFSNTLGTAHFEGVVLNPGFQGSSGKIFTISFRAKNKGEAALAFSSGAILANDGKGTDILSSLGNSSLTLAVPIPAVPVPGKKVVSSSAIDSVPPVVNNLWYNIDSIKFFWNPPTGATGMNYDISDNPDYKLSQSGKDIVSDITYDVKNFKDGAYYFFISFKSGNDWGPVSTKTLHLDRTPPEPFAITRQDKSATSTRPVFYWTATDKTSGVTRYQAKIGDGDWFDPRTIEKDELYMLPPQSPVGSRNLIVRAHDKAGNFRESSSEFSVIPQSGWRSWWYALIQFLSQWGWLLLLAVAFSVVALYFLIYRLLKWRGGLKPELNEFKNELRRDLKRLERQIETQEEKGLEINLSPSHIKKARESLQKEVKHIEEDIKKEIKKLDNFPET